MEFSHKSVLLWECIDALNIRPNGIYLDGTLGGGGHSLEICRRLTTGRLIGVDRDEVALEAAKKRLSRHARKVTLVHDNFENIALILDALNLDKIDGMLFDLGVSSPQLDDGSRGFSYMADAPLDMRMDQGSSLTAYEIVNNYPKDELRRSLYEYGEERSAPQIAAASARVRPGGRLCVITFHSLEDRIVKNAMLDAAKGWTGPPSFPVCVCGRTPKIQVLTKKPIIATMEEVRENPRARSAKLRVAVKL